MYSTIECGRPTYKGLTLTITTFLVVMGHPGAKSVQIIWFLGFLRGVPEAVNRSRMLSLLRAVGLHVAFDFQVF